MYATSCTTDFLTVTLTKLVVHLFFARVQTSSVLGNQIRELGRRFILQNGKSMRTACHWQGFSTSEHGLTFVHCCCCVAVLLVAVLRVV